MHDNYLQTLASRQRLRMVREEGQAKHGEEPSGHCTGSCSSL